MEHVNTRRNQSYCRGTSPSSLRQCPNKTHSPLAARGQQPGVPGHTLTAGQLCRAARCKCQALGIENSEDHRVKGALLFMVSLALFRNWWVFCCCVLFQFFFP